VPWPGAAVHAQRASLRLRCFPPQPLVLIWRAYLFAGSNRHACSDEERFLAALYGVPHRAATTTFIR